jgi:hypothetical protein
MQDNKAKRLAPRRLVTRNESDVTSVLSPAAQAGRGSAALRASSRMLRIRSLALGASPLTI